MKVDELFPSRFVKGEDILAKGSVTVTIRSVTIEKMGKDQEQNPVVWFERTDKGMVLKKTNAMTIKTLYGNDTEGWVGKRITLTSKKIKVGGEWVDSIVVLNSEPPDKQANGNAPQKNQEPAKQPRFESWQATEYRRKVVELSNRHDALFMETSDVTALREVMRGAEEGDGGDEELSVMPVVPYTNLCELIDRAVGSQDCANTILTYLLGRVIGKDTMPGKDAGRFLADDIGMEGPSDWADALMAVWGVIKQEVKAT